MNSSINHQRFCSVALCFILVISADCQRRSEVPLAQTPKTTAATQKPWAPNTSPQLKQLVESAIDQTKVTTSYDPSYVGLDYPGGDVPLETGVCSDVVVRAFRKAGIDLQKEIHDDMARAWSIYPKKWGASRPDSNIDHRRVLNLMTYFDRQGKDLAISNNRNDYLPGDIVTWDLSSGVEHIGIVVNTWSDAGKGYLIVHNIGAGARSEDVLLNWKITGHYRYF
ncbi:MAG: DUF1287 domain-containing protein [Pyrinomonadaceae bacterium]|nr:DUF1287 domain-containing protein [Pyrinomonadaceae bacterium]